MRSARRLLLAASSLATLFLAAPALAQEQAAPSNPWAQAASDIPADAAVRFGVLPNGMRYAILRNATPPGQASLRLRIDAGSLMETDSQLGLAHFMEHMAFNGTKDIPENELLHILERLGLAFGADTNAFTSFDQTVYQLELPRTNDETVDTSLHIMREMVSSALMNADDIDGERGVIQGEERLRNTPGLRSLKAQFALLAPGQRLAQRLPIGDMAIITTAPRERFVEFYNAYYRPSRATLVAVGDFDVDAMEAKIRTNFADWVPTAADGPEPDLGVVAPRQPETRILVEPGIQSEIQLNWIKAPDLDPDVVAERKSNLLQGLGLSVLNRRLGEMARADNPPFISASASDGNLFDSLEIGSVSAKFNPGGWKRALETIEQEERRLVQFGVSDVELQREIVDTRTALQQAVASAATRSTPGLANAIAGAVNENDVFSAPQTNLDLFNVAVEGLTAAEVNDAAKKAFEGQGPVMLVVTPEAIEGGDEAVTAALEASRQVPVTAPAAQAELQWPYASFGAPGAPSARREIAEVGATVVTFPNGVRLTVKPTDFKDEQILIGVRTGIGDRGLPTDRATAQTFAPPVFTQGGLGKLTADEMNRVLTGRIYGAGFSVDDKAYVLSGATRPADLQVEMQLLAAYVTDPGLRPAPFDRIKALFPQILRQLSAAPGSVFQRDSGVLLAGGDRREGLPTAEEIAGFTNDDLRTAVIAGLAHGPVEITMVGDVTVEDAISATAATFGALPARGPAPAALPGSDQRHFPAATAEPVHLTHDGPANQALGFIAWPTTDSVSDRTEARRLSMLAAVMQLRVLDKIREEMHIAYAPSAGATSSRAYPGYGYLAVTAETPPDKLPALFEAVDAIAASLRDTPITEDELTRAKAPAIESLRRSQAGNEYWMGQLQELNTDPGALEQIRTNLGDLEAVSVADIQALARQYLKPDTAYRIEVVSTQPAAPAEVAPAAATSAPAQ